MKYTTRDESRVANIARGEASGVARPGPTRACALPSAINFESRDSTMDQTKINSSANNHKSVTNINATA